MKIKLFSFLLCLGTFSIATAEDELKGWEEGVAAVFETEPMIPKFRFTQNCPGG